MRLLELGVCLCHQVADAIVLFGIRTADFNSLELGLQLARDAEEVDILLLQSAEGLELHELVGNNIALGHLGSGVKGHARKAGVVADLDLAHKRLHLPGEVFAHDLRRADVLDVLLHC